MESYILIGIIFQAKNKKYYLNRQFQFTIIFIQMQAQENI